MTKEQEKAIEKLNRILIAESGTKNLCTAVDIKDLKIVLNLIQKQQEENTSLKAENEKKDKIINEMLEEYEYNARINIKNFCDEEMRKDTCIQDCKNCIKQYFEKEIENAK